MPDIDLDAIRARCDDVRDGEYSWAGIRNLRSPLNLDETYALLAEVERLKAERDEAHRTIRSLNRFHESDDLAAS